MENQFTLHYEGASALRDPQFPDSALRIPGGHARMELPFDWVRVADERLTKNVTTLSDALRKVGL